MCEDGDVFNDCCLQGIISAAEAEGQPDVP